MTCSINELMRNHTRNAPMLTVLLQTDSVRRAGRHNFARWPLALALFVAALSFLDCGTKQEKAQPVFIPLVPVTVAPVVQKTVPVQVQNIGTGEAYSTVSVRSQIEGPIEKALFTQGEYVKQGDLLFLIDRRPYEAELNQAEANLARDTAQEAYAKVQAERSQKLYQDGIVSKDQFDQFSSNADALAAAVRADKATVESAKVRLGYCSITAPI